MKKIMVLMLLMMSAMGLTSCGAQEDSQGPDRVLERPSSRKAPDFVLQNLEGESVELAKYRETNTPVLIKFWTTWCPYCRNQISKMNWARQNFSEEELAVLSINIQEPREKVKAYAAREGIKYEVLFDDDSKVADEFGFEGVPTFFLIDGNGFIVQKTHGLDQSLIDNIEMLQRSKKSE